MSEGETRGRIEGLLSDALAENGEMVTTRTRTR